MLMSAAGLAQRGNVFCDHLRFARSADPYKVGAGLARRRTPGVCLLWGDIICSQERALRKRLLSLFYGCFGFSDTLKCSQKAKAVVPSPHPNGNGTVLALRAELHHCPFAVNQSLFLLKVPGMGGRNVGESSSLWCHRVWGETQIDQKDLSYTLAETTLSWAFPPPSVSFKDGSLVQQLWGRIMWCRRNRLLLRKIRDY